MDQETRDFYSNLAGETNPVGNIHHYLDQLTDETVGLADKRLVKIERLRIIGFHIRDYPRWDISYCYGRLANGDLVRVDLGDPGYLRGRYKAHLVDLCVAAGRYGKALKIFEAVSTLPG
jgi:hypothetical protein